MKHLRTVLLAASVAAAAALSLTACSSAEPIELGENSVVVDVRTPAEYAEGHLDGAANLDLTGGALAAALPNLDPELEYVVYCKSGNRSGQAAAMLEDAGFDVVDAGAMPHAAEATGLDIVR